MTSSTGLPNTHPDRYARFRSDVVWCLKVLTAFPLFGESLVSRRGLRANPVHPYLVTYRVDKRARKIIVLAIVPIYIDVDADDFDVFSMPARRRPAQASGARRVLQRLG
jgi:hypothetical protein